jgi:hypothetical protein
MKVESGRGVSPASGGGKRAGGATAAGFAPSMEEAKGTAATAATSAPPSIEALLALQGENVDPDKRRRQLGRGRSALEALAKLERALADGVAPAALKTELERARKGAEATGEAGLDALMLEIDTRVAVELAKLEMARPRAA